MQHAGEASLTITFGPDRPLRLLLVEDSVLDARLLQESLLESSLGPFVQSRHVETLAAAAEALDEAEYDCVLLDLDLPDGRGPQIVERLREVGDAITIVVMTGHESDEIGLQAIHYGAQEYLIKGQIGGNALARIIRHAVERNRLLLELQALREREYFLATHDPLTGLPNRQLFRDRAETALAQAQRQGNRIALCYIDLDGFKPINDVFGHASGDTALREVAGVLRSMVRGSDTVARIGGDEFVILVSPAASVEQVTGVAARVGERIGGIRQIDRHEVQIGASVGIALYPDHAENLDELLMHADIAMLQAKTAQPGGHLLYSPDLGQDRDQHSRLAAELARALEEDRVQPYYQPWWDVQEQTHAGIEVLARWHGSSGEMIYPDEFLPAAERSGRLMQLGQRMLQCAQRDVADWLASGLITPLLEINLSKQELRDKDYIEQICAIAAALDWEHTRLQVQIDGTSLLRSRDPVLPDRLALLRDNGMRVALGRVDVFTPTSMLSPWNVDSIRLSPHWLHDQEEDVILAQRDTLASLLDYAERQSADLIANGVESEAQRDALQDAGFRYLQGFWKSCPADAEATVALLASR